MLDKFKKTLKKIPSVRRFVRSERWGRIRYRITRMTSGRKNSPCTRFLRSPLQYEALCGPVMDFFSIDSRSAPLTIAVIGCSNGSEPYSIASVLKTRRPDVSFEIKAFDINEEWLEMGRGAWFPQENVYNNEKLTAEFVETTFDEKDNLFWVKEDIARYVQFAYANALDPNLKEIVGEADIVYAQHFLYHLPTRKSMDALRNVCTLMRPRGALFIDGIDLDVF